MRHFLIACALAALAACASPAQVEHPGVKRRPDLPGEWARFQNTRRLAPGMDALPMDALARAQAHARAMPRYNTRTGELAAPGVQPKAAAPRWQFLGPDNVAGRARALVFDPRDSERLLIAGVSGGIWESTNGGTSWRVLSDDAANINVGVIAIDPVEPDTIYAGTGELYRNSEQPYSAMWGQGILRSNDNGATFQQLAATANDNFRYVADLVVSPHDHRRLYAATNTGLWRSEDAGVTFTQVLRPADGAGNLRYEGCNELQVLADATRDRILAACASRSTDDRYYLPGTILPTNSCNGPCPAALFLNPDASGGGTWQSVLTESGMGRTIVDASRSSPNVVYAVSASLVPGPDRTGDGFGDYDNGLHAVWRSEDAGQTWAARVRNTSSNALSTYLLSYADSFDAPRCGFGAADPYSAGWYNMALAVNPLDPDVVWVAGMEHYRSDDGGLTFGKASWWWNPNIAQYVHADQHLLRYPPDYSANNPRLYSANDGGLAMIVDDRAATRRDANAACGAGTSGTQWVELTAGLGTTQFYTGAVTADGTAYMGGTQDNGTLLNVSDGQAAGFAHIFGGDGAQAQFDPRGRETIYVSYQNVAIQRGSLLLNGTYSFTPATNGLADTPIFIMPYQLDPSAPDRLYAGATRLWRTDDQGRNWRQASARFGTAFAERVSALAISPTDPNRMLVGNQRRIHYNQQALASTAGTVWESVAPRTGWVSSLAFDPLDANIAYATYSTFGGEHVWRSDDSGRTWRAIDGGGTGRLPDVPVHTIAVDPVNRARLFIGTDIGVFVSTDAGAHWAVENSGFANVITESLQVARGDATRPAQLYAFTYGRGVWRVPLADLDGVAAYAIGADTSGAFYNAQQSGHGWVVESVLANGVPSVVAAWYTYLDGEQRWLYGVGPVDGNRARVAMSITRNGDFPPNHVASATTIEPWGTLELSFDDADRGTAAWTTAYAGFTNGSLAFERIATLSPPASESANGRIASCHSGSWYDAAQPGHGLQVQVLGPPEARQMLAVWYAYLDGQQRYLIGNGPVTGDVAEIPMVTTRGGAFPPAFDPAAVVRDPWGTLRFRAIDGNRARIEWTSTQAGFGSGTLDVVRLTGLTGRNCG